MFCTTSVKGKKAPRYMGTSQRGVALIHPKIFHILVIGSARNPRKMIRFRCLGVAGMRALGFRVQGTLVWGLRCRFRVPCSVVQDLDSEPSHLCA